MDNLIDILSNAKSIAVIGASNKVGRPGYTIMKNLIDGKFEGVIYPINPREEEILGIKAFRNLRDIPSNSIDICIIAIAAHKVPSILKECCEKHAKLAIIISAGFSEVGNRDLEKEILSIAKDCGIRILGPNTAGLMYIPSKLFASIETTPLSGDIAFIAQSGALASIFIEILRQRNLGLSLYLGLGNRIDIDEVDALELALRDSATKSIAMYLEGFKRGREFLKLALEAIEFKPITLLLGGRSRAGSRAIQSHTASLALDTAMVIDILKQYGICVVDTLEDLANVSYAIPRLEPVNGKKVCILTNSGGPSVLATDYIEMMDLEVPELSDSVRNELRKFLPSIAILNNPIDMTAEADYERVYNSLKTLASCRDCDYIVFIYIPTASSPWGDVIDALSDISKEHRNVIAYVGGEDSERMVLELEKRDIPVVTTLKSIATTIRCSYIRAKNIKKVQQYRSLF